MFCDLGHFSVLHTDTFGNAEVLAVEPYEVRRTEWTVEADYRYPSVNPVAERARTAADPSARPSSSTGSSCASLSGWAARTDRAASRSR
jgi:vanillate O-demethylase monooxygenase subunit